MLGCGVVAHVKYLAVCFTQFTSHEFTQKRVGEGRGQSGERLLGWRDQTAMVISGFTTGHWEGMVSSG